MARSVISHQAADKILPLNKLAEEIEKAVHKMEAGNV
jgi:chemotaxis response regulator CheB